MVKPMQRIDLVTQQLRQGASAFATPRPFRVLKKADATETAVWLASLADMLDAALGDFAAAGETLTRAQVHLPVIIDAEYTEVRA